MDKDNQHENPLGEELNNFPQNNGLPSIWDDISQELDAVEELDLPMENGPEMDVEHLADVADFAVIKNGFTQHFKTLAPPKFMWDHIEQGLESFTITDDAEEFSAIKEGFEKEYKETAAPQFSWSDLAEEIDKPVVEKEEDYSFVKAGFEKKYSTVVVPLFTWDDLAQRMDSEAALADTADNYTIIKESFEKEYKNYRPAAVLWGNIFEQLKLQTVWGRLAHMAHNSVYRNWARKAMMVGALGLMIIGGRSCVQDGMNETPLAENISIVHSGAETLIPKTNVDKTSKTTDNVLEDIAILSGINDRSGKVQGKFNAKAPKGLLPNAIAKENTKNAETLEKDNDGQSPLVSNITANEATHPTINSNEENATTSVDNSTTTENTASNSNSNSTNTKGLSGFDKDYFGTQFRNQGSGSYGVSGDYNVRKGNLLLGDIPLVEQGLLFDEETIAAWAEQNITLDFSETMFPLFSKELITNTAFEDMRDFVEHAGVRRTDKTKRLTFEIGLIGRGGTSLLIGEDTKHAFDNKSLKRTDLSPSGAIGVLFNCGLSANDAIVVGAYPYAELTQSFGKYSSDGNYLTSKIKLTYIDFTLGYQRTLLRYNNLSKFPAKIYARFDLGLGYLTQSEVLVNDLAIESDDFFNKLNISLGLSLGSTHQFGPLTLDYGLMSSMGMNAIVAQEAAGQIAPANLLHVGAYLSLRYRLFSSWNPNKGKNREFEWSPPFYIEVPIP